MVPFTSHWNRFAVPGCKPTKRFCYFVRNPESSSGHIRHSNSSVSPPNITTTKNAAPGRIHNRFNVAPFKLTTFTAVDATEQNRNCVRFGLKALSNRAKVRNTAYFNLPYLLYRRGVGNKVPPIPVHPNKCQHLWHTIRTRCSQSMPVPALHQLQVRQVS